MKKILLGGAQYVLGIEQTDRVEGRATGFPILTFRKVGHIGTQVGDIVSLPMAQIDALTDHEESFGIVFSNEESMKVVAGYMELLINGSVNTLPHD